MSHPILGKSVAGASVSIDVERLIESRALLTANSGGGKSWAIRYLLEQTHGLVQHLVLDPEGEFSTLRERFDYVIAGKGGDCPAEVRSAGLLARRLLELRTSAIIDLYELDLVERRVFVRNFLEALDKAPKEIRNPALVIVDEAHEFAPEKGSAESSAAVSALMSRGRKRGLCGVLATQRLAKLSKDVAAEANNVMVGRVVLDVDQKRAREALGMSDLDARTLRTLKPGTFYAFGPAISDDVVQVQFGQVQTSHPKSGQRNAAAAPPPPREKVRKILGQLADLPAEAEAELRTITEARAKIRDLERELAVAKKAQPEPKVERVEVPVLDGSIVVELRQLVSKLAAVGDSAREKADEILRALPKIDAPVHRAPVLALAAFPRNGHTPAMLGRTRPDPALVRRMAEARSTVAPAEGLNGPEQRILDSLAWWESVGVEQPSRVQVAVIARYSPSGGAFQNPLGALRTKGCVDYPSAGSVALTEQGRAASNPPGEPATSEELHERLRGILNGPQWRILEPLLASYPEPVSRADVAAAAGYAPDGGAFQNPLGSLRSLGLIDYPSAGNVVALPVLFLETAGRR